VRKGNWRRRHRVAAARGAGACFIRREDHNQPVAHGFKATDPEGAARAKAACCKAQLVSSAAQAEAQRQRRAEACMLWMDATCNASRQLREYLDARNARYPGRAPPSNDRIERVLRMILEVALSQWEALAEQEKVSANV
jgi:hypothetical protein